MVELNEICKLIKEDNPLEALEYLKREAPDNFKKVIENVLNDPTEIKKLEEPWRQLVSLVYFSYVSKFTSERNDNQSLVSCVVSSTNAVKLCNALGIDYLIPKFLRNAARALILMGMKEEAEKMLLEAERIAENCDELEFARVENDFATLLFELGRYEEALDKIENALRIRIALANDEELAETLLNAGEIYKKVGDFEMSEKCFREAEKIYRSLMEIDESAAFNLAITLSNFSMLRKMRGDYREAEKLLTESLEIMEDLEKRDRDFTQFVATTLKHLGDLYREMKDYEKAQKFYEKSREKFRDFQARLEISSNNN